MANYANLKSAIQEVIRQNGNNEITGALMQQTLLSMVGVLGAGYQFMGIATTSMDPGTPDYNVAYLAPAGTYPNFGNKTIATGYIGVLSYNGTWAVSTIAVGGSSPTPTPENAVLGGGQLSLVNRRFPAWSQGTADIKSKFITMMSVDANGVLQVQAGNNLGNTSSELLHISDLTITPNADAVIFKVVFYDETGAFQSATPYMARSANTYVTQANVVQSYTITNQYCRIVVANTTLSTQERDKSIALAKIDFSGADATYPDTGHKMQVVEAVEYFSPAEFRAYVPVSKMNGKWMVDFDPSEWMITDFTTRVFVAPNGVDSNNGLTPATPVKTLEQAATIGHTIILLPGTYTSGVNFTAGCNLSQVNLIGYPDESGDVIVDCDGSAPVTITGDAYVQDIIFTNGDDGSLKVVLESTAYNVCLAGCQFNNSILNSYGGLTVQGGTVYVYKCQANGNIKDGFNYHYSPVSNIVPHVTEMYCEAHNNGNDDTYYSNNGSTAHDGALTLRVNCRYSHCKGGLLADVNAKTRSYNFGITCIASSLNPSNSTEQPFQCSVYCGSGAQMWLYDVTSVGSNYDISCVDNGSGGYTNRQYGSIYKSGSVRVIVL